MEIIPIGHINNHMENISIQGIICQKQGPKQTSSGKWVGSFVVRDLTGSCTVTCWGEEEQPTKALAQFQLDDVVTVSGLVTREKQDSQGNWEPSTTIRFSLLWDEKSSVAVQHGSRLQKSLARMLWPCGHTITIPEILEGNETLVSFLGVVATEPKTKKIVSKASQKEMTLTELTVVDHAYQPLHLTIWNVDEIQRAQGWTPLNTVLQVTNVNIREDNYKKARTGSLGQKSVVIVNPDSSDAKGLYEMAQSSEGRIKDSITTSGFKDKVNPDAISKTVKVFDLDQMLQHDTRDQFPILIFASISNAHLEYKNLNAKCSSCENKLDGDGERPPICPSCPNATKTYFLCLATEICDNTGSKDGIMFYGKVAEDLLGNTAEDLACLSDESLEDIRQTILFRHMRFAVEMKPDKNERNFIGSVFNIRQT
eukprot:m.104900 g.104900  ORF g.104900 m.104900 type:complete len:425 (-) comp13863_c0_seq3:1361-2635(-)